VPLLGIVTVAVGLVGTAAVAVLPPAAAAVRGRGPGDPRRRPATAWLAALPWAAVRVPTPSLVELALCWRARRHFRSDTAVCASGWSRSACWR
jgi:hypothetical protein